MAPLLIVCWLAQLKHFILVVSFTFKLDMRGKNSIFLANPFAQRSGRQTNPVLGKHQTCYSYSSHKIIEH